MANCAAPRTVSTSLALLLAEGGRMLVNLFGGSTELGRGVIDMFSRRGGYSIAKAGALLGFEPATDLEAGMALTEEWARKEGLL